MKRLYKGIIVAAILVLPFWLWVSGAFGATYYVDTTCTDTNPASATVDGTVYDPATPACTGGSDSYFATIADINAAAATLTPGDSVSFRKGQEWREMLTWPETGTSGNIYTITSHGTGALPIINGSDVISTWTQYNGDEKIVNGTMEVDDNWASQNSPTTNERSEEQVHGDTYSRKFTVDSGFDGILSDAFTTVTSVVYDLTIWVYPDDDTFVRIMVRKGDNSGWGYSQDSTGLDQDAWNEINIEYTETAGGAGAYIAINSGTDTAGTWYADDVTFLGPTTNVWKTTVTTEPDQAFFDDTKGTNEAGSCPGDLNTDQEWCWSGNVLYQHSSSNPDARYTSPGTEATQRTSAIVIDDSYITIENIALEKTTNDTLKLECNGDSNIIIDTVTINYSGNNGIYADEINTLTIQDCTINDSYNNGIAIWGSAANAITNTTITRNTVDSTDTNDGITIHKDGGANDAGANHAITYNSVSNTTEEAYDITSGNAVTLTGNYSTNNTGGSIVIDNAVDGTIIKYHYSKDDLGEGIYLAGATNTEILVSIIENPVGDYCIDLGAGGTVTNTKLYGNTLIGDSAQLIRIGGAGVVGIEARNNIFYLSDETKAIILYTGANSDDSNSDFDYNGYYRTDNDDTQDLWEGGTWAEWQGGGQDANSRFLDPKFKNVGASNVALKPGSPFRRGAEYNKAFRTRLRPETCESFDPANVKTMRDVQSIGACGTYWGGVGW